MELPDTDPYDVIGHLTERRPGQGLVSLALGERPTDQEKELGRYIAEAVWLNLAGLPRLADQLLKGAK